MAAFGAGAEPEAFNAKTENSFSSDVPWQDGHCARVSPRTSTSNVFEQPWQRYSYSGTMSDLRQR
jgi:hypothetical protein